eukprot:TRINITY_DN1606_c0_g3_i2.p1 TRINITY_DN1606_c0_g3~~TRINITY_DN1606_c0_g3_i2.p1  ORF type:complete len:613 (-),score=115.75 TRINITY_DN1606_c0_g3_i2:183-2021(-)
MAVKDEGLGVKSPLYLAMRKSSAGSELSVRINDELDTDGESSARRCSLPGPSALMNAFLAGKMVIDPHSSSALPFWDILMTVSIVVVSISVPYDIGFYTVDPNNGSFIYESVTRVLTLLFMFDILLQFFISVQNPDNQRWIRMPNVIFMRYLKVNFLFDVFSVIPYGKLSLYFITRMGMGRRYNLVKVFDVLTLLRLLRANRLVARYEALFDVPYTSVRLMKLLMLLSLSLHWIACFWGFILSVEMCLGWYDGYTWVDALRAAKPGLFQGEEEQAWELYTASIYWSSMTITSIGYGDITATNGLEAWGATFAMAACGIIWANIIGSICAIASSMSAEVEEHEQQLIALNSMMRTVDLPQEMRVQLREFFVCRRGLFYRQKQKNIVDMMSPQLQGEVCHTFQEHMLSNVYYFHDVGDAFVVSLFKNFRYTMYPPKELIRLHGALVLILRGVVLRQAQLLSPGAIWGKEDVLLHNRQLWDNISPLALSYVDIQYIESKGLHSVLESHPLERTRIRRATRWVATRRAIVRRIVAPMWAQDRSRSTAVGVYQPQTLEDKIDEVLHLLKRPNLRNSKQFGSMDSSPMSRMNSVGEDLRPPWLQDIPEQEQEPKRDKL